MRFKTMRENIQPRESFYRERPRIEGARTSGRKRPPEAKDIGGVHRGGRKGCSRVSACTYVHLTTHVVI